MKRRDFLKGLKYKPKFSFGEFDPETKLRAIARDIVLNTSFQLNGQLQEDTPTRSLELEEAISKEFDIASAYAFLLAERNPRNETS